MLDSIKKSLVIFIYFALTLSTLLVFWQVRNFDFVNFDDNIFVYRNLHILNGLTHDSIIWAFTTANFGNWLPLTWLSSMLDYQLFGPNPGWMHLVNLLLHLANTLLLFAILKKMTGSLWPSAFVAAVFALHPMHVESVAWITERKDVLSTLFLLLTLAAYVSYVKKQSIVWYLLTILLFILGLLAKPMLVTVPFILLLLDYWPLNRFISPKTAKAPVRQAHKTARAPGKVLYRIIMEKVPFFALSMVSSIITFFVQHGSGALIDANALPLESRIAHALLSYARYMGKMFWPQKLTVFYPLGHEIIPFWQVAMCVLLLLIITIFVIKLGRNQKYLPVGWFWFLVTLIPVLGLIQTGAQDWADRYTYIPYIGLFVMIAWGIPELLSKWQYRKITLGISMLIVLTALGITAARQVSYWNNSSTLFSHAVEVTKDNYIAYFNLAEYSFTQGQKAAAIEYYKKSLQISPNYPDAVFALGFVLAEQGDLNQALGYFQKTLQLESGSVHAAYAHYYFGMALQKQNKLTESIAHFAQAMQIIPDFAETRNNLANSLIEQGKLDEALDQLCSVLNLKPDWVTPMNNLAFLMSTHPELKKRDVNEAARLARRACELTDFKNPQPLGTLAAAYAAAGRFAEAIETANTAVKLADAANQPQIKNILQYHLTFYTQGKPYIEPPQKSLPGD